MIFRYPSRLSANYQILGLVGQGQGGRVFCARRRYTGQLVALKEISQRLPTSQFLRELAFIASLQHPHVVAWQGLEQTQSGRYLVMDYCEAGTLRHLIKAEARLSLLQSLELVADVLAGLAYIHARGIFHCDLKPENILLHLTADGWQARVSDFNVAQWQAQPGQWPDHTGTPAYMAPEQFYGELSTAIDLYAVGVILFELLVGERPFQGPPGDLMAAHLSQSPEVPDGLPFLVQSLLSCALQKLPQKRFTSAQTMLQAVQLALQVEQALQPTAGTTVALPAIATWDTSHLITQRQAITAAPTALVTWGTQIYVAQQQRLTCLGSQSGSISFEQPIVHLCPAPSGCWVITRSPTERHDTLYSVTWPLNPTAPPPLQSWNTTQLTCLADPQGHWFATVQPTLESQQAVLQIWRLPHLQPVNRLNVPKLTGAVVLNQRYGLLILPGSHPQSGSHLRIFHRRGGWAGEFPVPVTLSSLVVGHAPSGQLLAIPQDQPAQALLIQLRPFQLSRIHLDLTPTVLTATQRYFVLLNATGQGLILNAMGSRLRSFDLGQNTAVNVHAIAPLTGDQVLVAGCWDSQEQLVTLDLAAV